MKEFSSKDIALYYDVSEDHYTWFWDLNKSRALHYGYWDTNTKSLREALANINEIMCIQAGIATGMRVLDAGCGIGGSAIWLSKNKKAVVTGITLSAKQAARGNAIIKKSGLEKSVHLEVQDFTNTNFTDQSFDVVWAIESVCHANNKKNFIQEAFRLLKPGGKLIVADFFIEGKSNVIDQKELDKWAHGWAVPFFEKKKTFFSMLCNAGFNAVEMKDSTTNILKSARRLYFAFFPGWVISKIYNLFNSPTEFARKNVYTAYYQYRTLKKGLWKYYIISAQK